MGGTFVNQGMDPDLGIQKNHLDKKSILKFPSPMYSKPQHGMV